MEISFSEFQIRPPNPFEALIKRDDLQEAKSGLKKLTTSSWKEDGDRLSDDPDADPSGGAGRIIRFSVEYAGRTTDLRLSDAETIGKKAARDDMGIN